MGFPESSLLEPAGSPFLYRRGQGGGVRLEILTFDRVRGQGASDGQATSLGDSRRILSLDPGENMRCGFPTERPIDCGS
jgi:hypothetical protein